MSESDEYLLAALRIAAGVDPIPERVRADARAAYALRLPGAILAGPIAFSRDTGIPAGTLHAADLRPGVPLGSGARSGANVPPDPPSATAPPPETCTPAGAGMADLTGMPGVTGPWAGMHEEPRLLRFGADGLTIDLEITIRDSYLDLAGHLHPTPARGTRVEIRTPHISKIRFPSETGQFATTGLPHGWLSLVCHRPGARPIATNWQCIRH
ncbi:hypothetical protein Skr01_51150 [Sphaerisporangium krabiense]|uniref:Uncharacterized protein n=1 Tax=Sphaerisporangium krabiense TaxID=763782 RepID=A0A7W9DSZ1_9ACTN|nr:hypothetical protein [Sphaerisporangium krabiense]MBB5630083.1 hypothetical protein [Sphaerisporangium krabiense]GII65030.1 hypothetical protein Skr01_51150 [Sphaerisporangium krabiense]